MDEDESLEQLLAMRKLLKTSLENSNTLSFSLDKTSSKLDEIHRRLPFLVAEAKLQGWRFSSLLDHMSHVIAPASAALRVFTSVQELEKSLLSSNQSSDLQTYISVVKRLEEALKLLSDSCSLAMKWLEDTVECLKENGVENDHPYLLNVKNPIRILHDLQKVEARARLNGGILGTAFDKLETEFKQILSEEGALLGQVFPVTTLQKLQAIIETLDANKRLKNCTSIYVEVRTSTVQRRFETLGTDYLEKTIMESDDFQDIGGYIDKWSKHLEIAVKDVYELEHKLCSKVFEKAGPYVSSNCFAKIATNSGVISLLRFGLSISDCKKDPIKLLKLLDVFFALDNLRVKFNRLFGSEPCSEIQRVTRELIKRLVNCISEIFWELPFQVELQRATSAPDDGGVPRLVSFVTEYCNQLLGSHYRPILTKILGIDQSWKNGKYHEELLVGQVYDILKEIAVNLDSWSKSYHDITLSYLFMMNNHCHFCTLKETQLGKMMGNSWLRAHERYRDYYTAMYLKETWGKLQALLNNKDPVVPASPTKRKRARESVRKTLHAFAEAFDQIYMQQSNWVVVDERLRQKMCQVAVQAVVPTYTSYLQNCMMLMVEDDYAGPGKYVKYTARGLEGKLKTMFQAKLTKNGSTKHTNFVSKVKKMEISQCHLTLTAT